MKNPLHPFVSRFVAEERGTIAVTRMFMVAAALSVGLLLVAIAGFGTGAGAASDNGPSPVELAEAEFRAANYGRDRATVLAEGPRAYYSPNEMRNRFNIFVDPRQTDVATLRSAHRTWVRRVNDPAYSQPGRASDLVRILEQAMAARGVEPHRGL